MSECFREVEEGEEAFQEARGPAILDEDIRLQDMPPFQDAPPLQAAEVQPQIVPVAAVQPQGNIIPQQPLNLAEEIIQMDAPPEERPLPNGRPYRFGDEIEAEREEERRRNQADGAEERRNQWRNAALFGLGITALFGVVYVCHKLRILLRRGGRDEF